MKPKKIEAKFIEKILSENYCIDFSLKNFLVFGFESKIFILSKDFQKIENKISQIPFFSLGLYFGQLKKEGKILLSLEGAQMIGKKAKKNIAILDEKNLRNFLLGFNVFPKKEINCEIGNFILLKFQDDIVGLGEKKEKYIENLMVKTKRFNF